MTRNQRIRKALDDKGIKFSKVGDLLNTSGQNVGGQLDEKKETNSIKLVLTVAKLTGEDVMYLIAGRGKKYKMQRDPVLNDEDHKLKDEFEQMKDQMNSFASTIKKITNFIGLDA